MTTHIETNGSKCAGESPDPIERLLERLQAHTLHPRFEDYGNFATRPKPSEFISPPEHYEEGMFHFWGNFYDASGAFSVWTNDEPLIQTLLAAIKANKATQAYADAKQDYQQRQTAWQKSMEAKSEKDRQERESQARAVLGL